MTKKIRQQAIRPAKAPKKKQEKKLRVSTPFRDSGGMLGSALGSAFGNPSIGRNIGAMLGSGIGTIFGSGEYQLSENSIVAKTSSQVPFMHSSGETIRFRHREFITDVKGSVAFAKTNYTVNPGVSGSFPMLSSIAENFTEYHFSGLCYEFKSTSADSLNSTNTALGTVALAAQYRADADVIQSKTDILNTFWAADTKPSESVMLPIECAPAESPMRHLYVRTATLGPNQDIKFYDLCKVSLATFGMQAVATIGELWVSYDVELRKPVNLSSKGIGNSSLFAYGASDTTFPFGTTRTTPYDNMGVTYSFQTLTIPAQYKSATYSFTFTTYGAAATFGGTPVIGYTNAVATVTTYYTLATNGFTLFTAFAVVDSSLPISFSLTGFTQVGSAAAAYSVNQVNPGLVGF